MLYNFTVATMSPQIVCVHGSWCTPAVWDGLKQLLENAGYEVHTPALPFHNGHDDQRHVDWADLSLQDYSAAMVQYVGAFKKPPLLMGHSMGALIAQMVATKVPVSQLILLNPIVPAGINTLRPAVMWTWFNIFNRWGFWREPIQLSRSAANYALYNCQPANLANVRYPGLVKESGRALAESLGLWPHHVARVRFQDIHCPVLVVGGSHDHIAVPATCRALARCYEQSRYRELTFMGHWSLDGWPLDAIFALIKEEVRRQAPKKARRASPAMVESA